MTAVRIPLLTGEGGGTPVASSPQRVYNLYPSVDPANKTGIVWKETPGWRQWYYGTSVELRGTIVFLSELYIVRANKLVRDPKGADTEVGILATSSGKIHMAEDGISLMITDGESIYRWDGSTYTTITLPLGAVVEHDLTHPTGIISHEGHFICYDKGTGRFWISDKNRGDVWPNLQYATAEDKPDNITGLASDRVLWIFGEYTTQAYYNNGGIFPFIPNPQGLLIYGMMGDTQAQLDNTSYWLARSKYGSMKVVKATGFAPVAVSSPQLESEWGRFSTVDDAYANTIMWEGHEWYVLTFPTAKRTYVYDTQGGWFRWGELDNGTGDIVAHPMIDYIYFDGKSLFTDGDGNIQELKTEVYNHNGKVMASGFRTNVQHVGEQRVFINNIIMDMRTGVSDEGVMSLRVSYDGGYTWGNWATRSLGKLGKYRHRVQWHRSGSGFNITLEGRITDEVPRQIMSGVIDVDVYKSYLDNRNDRAGLKDG